MKPLIIAHILLIICCVFYLAWWCFSFRPGFEESRITGLPGLLLIITTIFGLSGAGLSIVGINHQGNRQPFISAVVVVVAGIVLYVLLFYVTSVFMNRQITTELILIIGWLVLEILSYQAAYSMEQIDRSNTMFLFLMATLATITSLFFYLQYYRVSAIRGFFYGMIPLITEALCMILFLIVCRKRV